MAVQDARNPFQSLDYWRDFLFARFVDQEGDCADQASSPEKSDSSTQSAIKISRKRKLLTPNSTKRQTPAKRRRSGSPFPLSDKESKASENTLVSLTTLSPKSQENDSSNIGLLEDTSDSGDENNCFSLSTSAVTEPAQADGTPNSE
ncbi:hypothetical protein AOQ84DRAFT_364323 [Glonium stellatum]|uniref:Uncharacterized protein n=1 Tax=Glonium stellatum TaxID=574774 RepID=A0A8E2F092_9PEZI|nr:hypothetical protein AOQ84DRAFT_364323 [Glonium stellatum]